MADEVKIGQNVQEVAALFQDSNIEIGQNIIEVCADFLIDYIYTGTNVIEVACTFKRRRFGPAVQEM